MNFNETWAVIRWSFWKPGYKSVTLLFCLKPHVYRKVRYRLQTTVPWDKCFACNSENVFFFCGAGKPKRNPVFRMMNDDSCLTHSPSSLCFLQPEQRIFGVWRLAACMFALVNIAKLVCLHSPQIKSSIQWVQTSIFISFYKLGFARTCQVLHSLLQNYTWYPMFGPAACHCRDTGYMAVQRSRDHGTAGRWLVPDTEWSATEFANSDLWPLWEIWKQHKQFVTTKGSIKNTLCTWKMDASGLDAIILRKCNECKL